MMDLTNGWIWLDRFFLRYASVSGQCFLKFPLYFLILVWRWKSEVFFASDVLDPHACACMRRWNKNVMTE
jgi:hypothetical protein